MDISGELIKKLFFRILQKISCGIRKKIVINSKKNRKNTALKTEKNIINKHQNTLSKYNKTTEKRPHSSAGTRSQRRVVMYV